MKKSTKAALISAGIFPGAGHLWLKKYWLGAALATPSFCIIGVLVSRILQQANAVVQKINSGEMGLDVVEIHDALTKNLYNSDGQLLELLSIALIIIWLFSILHSYHLGKSGGKSGE